MKITLSSMGLVLYSFLLFNCAETKIVQTKNKADEKVENKDNTPIQSNSFSQKTILNNVDILSEKYGFYLNDDVKILFPNDLKMVENTLRKVGLQTLANEGIYLMNRAAENAIYVSKKEIKDKVKSNSFDQSLYKDFENINQLNPIYNDLKTDIKDSFSEFEADSIWTVIIDKYNIISKDSINPPDIETYITKKAINGLYKHKIN